MSRCTHTARAFTLTEMMVAILVTSILLLLVNQLFITTSGAISTGMKSGELMMDAEIIGRQIEDDFERIMGPNGDKEDGGFLVIVQNAIPDVEMVTRSGQFGSANSPGHVIRSDQVIFLTQGKEGKRIRSITPQDQNSYGSDVRAKYARVRYGHLARVDPDATPDQWALKQGFNRWANNWLLGRHETLLAGDDLSFDPNDKHVPNLGWAYNWLRDSEVDVVDQPLWDDSASGTYPGPRGLLSALEVASPYYAPLVDPTYDGAFAATPFRLPSAMPEPPLNNGQFDFSPDTVARMHPVLSSNVSDFIVEFAGDYNGDGELDRYDFSSPDPEWLNGSIIWYAINGSEYINDPDAGFDQYRPAVSPLPPSYGPGVDGFKQGGQLPSGTDDPRHVMYWLGPTELDNYSTTATGDYSTTATGVFVWRHDDESESVWPWLIRIRYRMHDPEGRIESATLDPAGDRETQLGQWFEHIVEVPRPRG